MYVVVASNCCRPLLSPLIGQLIYFLATSCDRKHNGLSVFFWFRQIAICEFRK